MHGKGPAPHPSSAPPCSRQGQFWQGRGRTAACSGSPTPGNLIWPQRKRRTHQCKVGLGLDTSRVLVKDAGTHLTYSSEPWRAQASQPRLCWAPLHIRNCRVNPYCSLYPLLHFPNLLITEHLQSPTVTCPCLLFPPRCSRLPSPPAAARSSADTRAAFAVCQAMLKVTCT